MEELSAFLDGLTVLLPYISDKTIEYDLNFAILGDMLMLFVSTVLSQQGESINVILEILSLLLRHLGKHFEEVPADNFGPDEPFLVVVRFEFEWILGDHCHIF
jgi:hypothetical protein